MKKFLLLLFFVSIYQITFSQDLNSRIAAEFFPPYANMTEIDGSFNGFYLIQPQDGIPYEQIIFFSEDEYGMRYYSSSQRTDSSVANSIIEIYGQKFSLGFRNGNYPRDIMWSEGEFWIIESNNRRFLCYITPELGTNSVMYKYILLFDLTDKQSVHFFIFETFAFGYKPQIGIYDQRLCILITNRNINTGNYHVVLYSFFDFEKILDDSGKDIELIFTYDKWEDPPFRIIGRNIPKKGGS